MWDDERIDAAIDETARQMTAGEPGEDFRVRVMARIDVRPRRAPLWQAIAVGVAAAAMVLVAVFVRLAPDVPHIRLKPDAPYEAKPQAPLVRQPPSPVGGFGRPRQPDAPYRGATGDFVRDDDSLELPSIDLDSIAVAALAAADSIDIDPLPPTPSIAVTPLDVENEGDPR